MYVHLFIIYVWDTHMFISGKNLEVLRSQLNEDLREIQQCLNCSKLSLNFLKTHYMIFLPRNKTIDDMMFSFMMLTFNGYLLQNFYGSKLTLI